MLLEVSNKNELEPVPNNGETAATKQVIQLSIQELTALMREERDLRLLDVRTDAEWEEGHLPEAKHIELADVTNRLDELDQGLPLVIYCRTGRRSNIAASLLKLQGFATVYNLAGGIIAWRLAGHRVVVPRPRPERRTARAA